MPHTEKVRESKLRIVLANGSLVKYPQGGGHWSVFLQYLFGLDALQHNLFWLELFKTTGDKSRDQRLIRTFLARFRQYGFSSRCAVLLIRTDLADAALDCAEAYGVSAGQIAETIRHADLLWNFCCTLRPPFLTLFKRRALIDLDPGRVQFPPFDRTFALAKHQTLLTIGSKLGEPDCQVPTGGRRWHRFLPFLYLPLWNSTRDPGKRARFTSVTQWTWEEFWHRRRVLSCSKRQAYLRFADMPQRTGRGFELAANIHPRDTTGDREFMISMGWKLANPNWVVRSPTIYQQYIKRSRAEFSCVKPIYRELKTGWFSDRSVAYLASGRPVLAEDTGFSDHLPTGRGLLCFSDAAEAVAGVAEIDGNYPEHMRAARELAVEYFDAKKWLPSMLSACGW